MSVRLVLFVSTLAALVFANQVWLDYAYGGVPIPWWRALLISAADWYLWALLSPAIAAAGARWPLTGHRRWRSIAVHVPASLVTAAVKSSFDRVLVVTFLVHQPIATPALKTFTALLAYWAILGAVEAVRQSRARQTRELQATRLEAELTRAHLEALRARLQPHWLFNTLNSIAALMREDVEAADAMMARLAELLRLTLQRAESPVVTVREELELTTCYLSIQEARFGDRLSLDIDVDDAALPMTVPSLLLQPLVENAFTHGVGSKPGRVHLRIHIQRRGDNLDIEIEDNGPGPAADWRPGVGISTTRERLAHQFGSAAGFSLERKDAGGTVARIYVPLALGR